VLTGSIINPALWDAENIGSKALDRKNKEKLSLRIG
jgi:hypothetical protein